MGIMWRLGGITLLGLSALAGLELEHLIEAMPKHPVTALEFVLATLSFVFASGGALLTILGPRVLEPQPVAEQWRRRT